MEEKQMKKILMAFILVVALIGCSMPGMPPVVPGTPDPETPQEVVEKIPVFAATTSISSPLGAMKSITIRPTEVNQAELVSHMLCPAVISWEENDKGYNIGDTYPGEFLGSTVTITISKSGEDIVFNGDFNDGGGYCTVTYHPDGSFDLKQKLIYEIDASGLGGTGFYYYATLVEMTAQLTDNSFIGEGMVYIYQWGDSGPEKYGAVDKYIVHSNPGYFATIFGCAGECLVNLDTVDYNTDLKTDLAAQVPENIEYAHDFYNNMIYCNNGTWNSWNSMVPGDLVWNEETQSWERIWNPNPITIEDTGWVW